MRTPNSAQHPGGGQALAGPGAGARLGALQLRPQLVVRGRRPPPRRRPEHAPSPACCHAGVDWAPPAAVASRFTPLGQARDRVRASAHPHCRPGHHAGPDAVHTGPAHIACGSGRGRPCGPPHASPVVAHAALDDAAGRSAARGRSCRGCSPRRAARSPPPRARPACRAAARAAVDTRVKRAQVSRSPSRARIVGPLHGGALGADHAGPDDARRGRRARAPSACLNVPGAPSARVELPRPWNGRSPAVVGRLAVVGIGHAHQPRLAERARRTSTRCSRCARPRSRSSRSPPARRRR